MYKNFFYHVN